jgi:uridylate kinase
MNAEEIIIICLGGSMIVPNLPDTEFITTFRSVILEEIEKGKRFVIFVGGGKTCSNYQDALAKMIKASVEDLDWIGIYSTRFNAELIRLAFKDYAARDIIIEPSTLFSYTEPVIIGAGCEPGRSTAYDAVTIAEQAGAKKIVNLMDIDYLYNKDPREHKDAKIVTKSTWKEFRTLLPREWSSGLSFTFDPVAAAKAESLGIEVVVMNGKNIKNFKKYLSGKEFVGTSIK